MDSFPAAAAIVLDQIEGPDSDDPNDPGGLTRFGIALKKHPELTRAQLASFTRDDALAFYRAKYWDAHCCGLMPWRWALAVFDCEVNQGGNAIAWVQQAGGVTQDGKIGPMTTVVTAGRYADEFFRTFLAIRIEHYELDDAMYRRGWLKRVIFIAQQGEHPPEATAA